jgi:hypothetical protein
MNRIQGIGIRDRLMDLVLDITGKQSRLHAENCYQVQYGIVGGAGGTNFEPCKELEGKKAEIDILGVIDQHSSGLIKSVTIVK